MPNPYTLIDYAWVFMLVVWCIGALTSKRTVQRQSVSSRIVQVCFGLLAGWLLFSARRNLGFLGRDLFRPTLLTANLGLVLTVAGLAVAIWARVQIGRNWSGTVTLKQGHELVQSGPYRFVRHPIYSGILLALFGTAVAIADIAAFLAVLIAAIAFRLKYAIEESFMIQQFGSQYTEYRRHVKALIPLIW